MPNSAIGVFRRIVDQLLDSPAVGHTTTAALSAAALVTLLPGAADQPLAALLSSFGVNIASSVVADWRQGYRPDSVDVEVIVATLAERVAIALDESAAFRAAAATQLAHAQIVTLAGAAFRDQPARVRKLLETALEELRAGNLNGLELSQRQIESWLKESGDAAGPAAPPDFRAEQPYTLLRQQPLIGREEELSELQHWVFDAEGPAIRSIVSVGGGGKSALAWTWFSRCAELRDRIAGGFWWSFYRDDLAKDNWSTDTFARSLLRYLEGTSQDATRTIQAIEEALLRRLSGARYLVVLDGVERLTHRYAHFDPLATDNPEDQDVEAIRTPGMQRRAFNPASGDLLRRLALVNQSRILITSRVPLADLENAGQALAGTAVRQLGGLQPDDAWRMWCSFGVTAERDAALRLFDSFAYHPLVIRVLAGHVANCRPAPDFESWQRANPDIPIGRLRFADQRHEILAAALHDVSGQQREILFAVAAFRTPVAFDALSSLFIGDGKEFRTAGELIDAVTDLEDRGLVGWDGINRTNEMHPTVRMVLSHRSSQGQRHNTHSRIVRLFEHLDVGGHPDTHRENFGKLLQLHYSLMESGRIEEAATLCLTKLFMVMHYGIGGIHTERELMSQLVAVKEQLLPETRAAVLKRYALALSGTGAPQEAVLAMTQANDLYAETLKEPVQEAYRCANAAICEIRAGRFADASKHLKRAIDVYRENGREAFRLAIAVGWQGRLFNAIGDARAEETLQASAQQLREAGAPGFEGLALLRCARFKIERERVTEARADLTRAVALVSAHGMAQEITFARLCEALIDQQEGTGEAERLLCSVVADARVSGRAELELDAILVLSDLYYRAGAHGRAKGLLDELIQRTEGDGYPVIRCDAFGLLAHIALDEGDKPSASELARRARRLAHGDALIYAKGAAVSERIIEAAN